MVEARAGRSQTQQNSQSPTSHNNFLIILSLALPQENHPSVWVEDIKRVKWGGSISTRSSRNTALLLPGEVADLSLT